MGIRAYAFDGDTPGDAAKRCALGAISLSPDMLHQGILPHHTKWAQFFESLRFVVIDELHTYRGVFGSHMANVVRRLRDPRTRRWRVTLYGRRVMGTSLYLRDHYFPKAYSRIAA